MLLIVLSSLPAFFKELPLIVLLDRDDIVHFYSMLMLVIYDVTVTFCIMCLLEDTRCS